MSKKIRAIFGWERWLIYGPFAAWLLGLIFYLNWPHIDRLGGKTFQAEARAILEAIYSGQKGFFAEWSCYAVDTRDLDYIPEGKFNYVFSLIEQSKGDSVDLCTLPLPEIFGPPRGHCRGNDSSPSCFANDSIQKTGHFFAAVSMKSYALQIATKSKVADGFLAVAFSCQKSACTEEDLDIWTIDQNKNLSNIQPGSKPADLVPLAEYLFLFAPAWLALVWYFFRQKRSRGATTSP